MQFYFIVDDNMGRLGKIMSMTGLKNKARILPKVLVKGDPTEQSKSYGSVIIVEAPGGQLSISVYKGFTFRVASLPDALCYMVKLFYLLNINYPSQCSSFLKFLGILHGEKGTVNNTMKDIIAKL